MTMFKRWQSLRAQFNPLASRLAVDPSYRLRSYHELAQAAQLGFSLDVNRATVDDWLRLPGLSIRQAQGLVRLRQGGVQFHCLEDLAAALGVSAGSLSPLAPVLSFCYYEEHQGTLPSVNLNQASTQQLGAIPGLPLELAQAMGIPTLERPVDKTELFVADEVFLSGTAAKVTPVRRIETTDLPVERPIMERLRERLTAITEGRDPAYDHWVTRVRLDG